jgi:hypothetical protein
MEFSAATIVAHTHFPHGLRKITQSMPFVDCEAVCKLTGREPPSFLHAHPGRVEHNSPALDERSISGPCNVSMKMFLVWTTSLAALLYSNLAVAQQSISPATREIPVTRQDSVHPQTGSEKPTNTATKPNSESTLEIPQAVKGCWEVTIDGPPDSFSYIKGPQIGGWLPMKKTLCFVETASGSFEITYQSVVADTAYAANKGYSVSDFQSHEEVIGSDEQGNFTLRSVTTNRQPLGLFSGQVEIDHLAA